MTPILQMLTHVHAFTHLSSRIVFTGTIYMSGVLQVHKCLQNCGINLYQVCTNQLDPDQLTIKQSPDLQNFRFKIFTLSMDMDIETMKHRNHMVKQGGYNVINSQLEYITQHYPTGSFQ